MPLLVLFQQYNFCCLCSGAQNCPNLGYSMFRLKPGAAPYLNGTLPREKSPWKKTRHWLFYVMFFLTFGVLSLYSWFSLAWQPSGFGTNGWFSIYSESNNILTTISHSHHSPSPFFVEYPYPYRFILDEPNKCREERPFVVVMIPVAPQNRHARDVIRQTWGSEHEVLGRVVSYYFFLGKSRIDDEEEPPDEQILQESQEYHDILQSNFLDSYKNLTIKTMVMLEWLSSHCPNTTYAMKIDSDTFLNVQNLIFMLLRARRHNYMTGLVARDAQVLRDPNSKWFLSSDVFPESLYPPYALGMGYVFSLDLTNQILKASKHVKAVYIEDVYLGLCMRHLGIPLTDPPHGDLFRVNVPSDLRGCSFASVITTLLRDSEQIMDVWKVYKAQPQSKC